PVEWIRARLRVRQTLFCAATDPSLVRFFLKSGARERRMRTSTATKTSSGPNRKGAYLEAMALAERLHRQFLELIETELHQHGIEDINSVQALMLFNIGDDQPSVGELVKRGYYLGTNATYNVHKMVEAGYVSQERSTTDRRAFRVRLTRKGKQLWQVVDSMV